MKFSLKENFLLSMDFHKSSIEEGSDEKKIKFESDNSYEGKEYYIDFKIKMKIKEGYLIDIVFRSVFFMSVKLSDEILNDKKLEIMCCTVAYPYFRAYVTNFTVMSGFKPVILNNINFFAFFDQENDGGKN